MWLRSIFVYHAAYLLSHPEKKETIGPISGIFAAKVALLPGITKIQGRVDLMTDKASRSSEKKTDRDITQDSLLVYQDQGT